MAVPPELLERATRIFNETIEAHIQSSELKLKKGALGYKPFTLLRYTLIEIANKAQFLGWIFITIYHEVHSTAAPRGPTVEIIETLDDLEEGEDFKEEFVTVAKHLYGSFFSLGKWPPLKRSYY